MNPTGSEPHRTVRLNHTRPNHEPHTPIRGGVIRGGCGSSEGGVDGLEGGVDGLARRWPRLAQLARVRLYGDRPRAPGPAAGGGRPTPPDGLGAA
jgi:hypothetical protein